jgi:hypothetical protein
VQQEDIMKLPREQPRSEPANYPHISENSAMESEISGFVFHPIRRASDTCPLSRVPYTSDCPPTSPKIHELRERKLSELASKSNLSTPARK